MLLNPCITLAFMACCIQVAQGLQQVHEGVGAGIIPGVGMCPSGGCGASYQPCIP
jgi:hypothetical protein